MLNSNSFGKTHIQFFIAVYEAEADDAERVSVFGPVPPIETQNKLGAPEMTYNPLSQADCIERTNRLASLIIVKAMLSDRGDIILAMNDADLEKLEESVARTVRNILEVKAQRVSDYKWPCVIKEGHGIVDPTARFNLIPDDEIEKEVSAYFEINGKLQYREVVVEDIISLCEIDKSVKHVRQQM